MSRVNIAQNPRNTIVFDYETFYTSAYSLSKIPTQNYVLDDAFEVIGVAVKLNDEPTRFFSGTHPETRKWLEQFPWEDSLAVAHNAMFDGAILEWVFKIKPHSYFCTMMASRPLFAPYTQRGSASLRAVSDYLGIGQKGTEVVQALGKRRTQFTVADMKAYGQYCINDVELTRQIYDQCELPVSEAKLIDLTIKKFTRPVIDLDIDVLHTRLNEVKFEKEQLLSECGVMDKSELRSAARFAELLELAGATPPIKWSEKQQKNVFAFSKTDKDFLALQEHPSPMVRALVEAKLGVQSSQEETRLERFIEISQSMYQHGSYFAVPLLYYGAHSGRFSGLDKLNLQNLPRGSALRKSMVAPTGFKIVAGDLSNIEGRITAAFCGEDSLIQQFEAKKDIYCEFGGKLFGRKITKEDPKERFISKTCVLGLGYGTGAAKLYDTLKIAGVDVTTMDAERYVTVYRNSFPNIRAMWTKLNRVIERMATGNSGELPAILRLKFNGEKIYLPNGMALTYPNLRYDAEEQGYVYDNKVGKTKLYGAKLLENIVQAVARIVLTDAELFLASKGYEAALSVHDELVFIVPDNQAEKFSNVLERVLTLPIPWMPHLPLEAEVHYGDSYYDCK